ncbi:SAM and SH3 domain-containing protein 3 [Bienertia sinuspersici]
MMKVEIPEMNFTGPRALSRQASTGSSKVSSCLCSPTTHAGSFRCRLHRCPSLHRTKSVDSPASSKPDHATHNTSNY